MLENKDFCDYDTCVALKELGYNRGAYAYYFPNHKEDLIFNTHQMRGCSINEMLKGYNTYPKNVMGHELIDAPTMWEAQKWLREEKDIHIEIPIWLTDDGVWKYNFRLQTREFYDRAIGEWDTFEEALSEGIKEALNTLR